MIDLFLSLRCFSRHLKLWNLSIIDRFKEEWINMNKSFIGTKFVAHKHIKKQNKNWEQPHLQNLCGYAIPLILCI